MRDYSELRAKAEAATPGEWSLLKQKLRPSYPTMIHEIQDRDGNAVVKWSGFDGAVQSKAQVSANAAHIAAANPATILALLDELEALRAKPKRVRTTHDDSLFADIDPQVAADFKAMRTKQRASVTPTAMAGIRREADKAGLTLEQALIVCCERNWRGFKAEWIDRAMPIVRQSVNDDAKRRLFGGFDEFGSTDAPR